MTLNTPILLGDYFDNFINTQVQSGRYSSANEVIRTALRLFEEQETKTQHLINELKTGESSGMIVNFDRSQELSKLHAKYLHQ